MKKPNKKVTIISLIAIVVIVVVIAIFLLFNNNRMNNTIPDGYIAVFHGGGAEVTRETYIYKNDNGHANYGFTYISTETIWGVNPEAATTEIIGRGSFEWTDGAFGVAKENRAYSYVTIPGDNKTYSIEEFMGRFLMN